MSLKDQLVRDLQDAMRSGDEMKKSTIRLLRSAVRSAEMARTQSILSGEVTDSSILQDPRYQELQRHRRAAETYESAAAQYREAEQLDLAAQQDDLAARERSEVGRIVEQLNVLDDKAVQDVLRTEIKQRRDAQSIYERANRMDLAEKEQAEAALIEAYLPQQMSEAEIEAEVRTIINEVGASGPKDMSKVMPVAMSRLKGRAEGRLVNKVVTSILSESSAQ